MAELAAQWRFTGNYVPQHYGNWQFSSGTWNFGADKRIECEACGYVTYMLIDRLGDEFNHQTVVDEIASLCPRVQWVFRSACEHVLTQYKEQVINMVMRLTEPEDICKHIQLCAPSMYDAAMGLNVNPGARLGVPGAASAGLHPAFGAPAAYAMAQPQLGYLHAGGQYGLYPMPGQRPLASNSPYSPFSFGGYDGFGFPMPHPGVPSSTPVPPSTGAPGAAGAPPAA